MTDHLAGFRRAIAAAILKRNPDDVGAFTADVARERERFAKKNLDGATMQEIAALADQVTQRAQSQKRVEFEAI